jgi:isoquinoline 1-oxidoreductase beta subunit
MKRREFIVSSAAASGGLALGMQFPFAASGTVEGGPGCGAEVNLWVVVKPDDTCVIRIARSEMGQGTRTGLAQLVAEELECDWKKGHHGIDHAGTEPRLEARMGRDGNLAAAGASAHRRITSAAAERPARIMLLQAAANQWAVPVGELSVADGVITHAASKRSIRYGKVAAAAAQLPAPDLKSIKLKEPKDWKIAGKPFQRLDTADKLDGRKVYAIDVQLPNLLNAAIRQCPVFGGKLVSFDGAAIARRPGVRGAVKVDDSTVAVVADTWWHARTALEALPIVWDEGPGASQSSAMIAEHLKGGPHGRERLRRAQRRRRTEGDRRRGEKGRGGLQHAVPCHATMEPMNCTARITPERGEVWVATQNSEGFACCALGSVRTAARQVRGVPA